MKKSTIYIIVFIALTLSFSIGMMDYETQSLWHLLTSDGGNVIFLLILTIFFSLFGVGLVLTTKAMLKN
ncbi:MAG: hypothetical protein AB8G11_16855 [Saprospiraceae bacterium]